MSLDLNSNISVRDQWSREHGARGLKELLNKKLREIPNLSGRPPFRLDEPLPPPPRSQRPSPSSDAKVAIVGAGAAGLFTAMILDYLNDNESLKSSGFRVSYDIFEAAGKDRVGGRLFTYNFIPQDARNPPGQHDYYDVGAMRFPQNKVMTRLFDLFAELNMEMKDLSENPLPGSLVPYYMQNFNDKGVVFEPWCFNNFNEWGSYAKIAEKAQDSDAFHLNHDKSQKIPESILKNSPDDTFNRTVEKLREALRNDLESSPLGNEGFKLLLAYDKYSTRQFLGESDEDDSSNQDDTLPPFNYETIEFLETFNGGTNWYDQAHSETVLESLDFEYFDDNPKNKWWAILGGARQLALRMEDTLINKPNYLSRVAAIRVGDKADMEIDIKKPTCGWNTDLETREYNGVFNTTTLGCLKRIDIRGTSLNYTTLQAIRSLGYGPSAKAGIKFKRAWWIHDLPDGYKIKRGGSGHSDLSIRTCIYPSYNINDPSTEPAVLECSYTWQQDAERIGALMSSSTNHDQQLKEEADLKELLLRDLARMHTNPKISEEDLYKTISDLYLDHYAHDWTHDPNTAGAFAFFRPQQFTNVWNKLIHPSGNLIIIGEAASPHHAWVVGALESAVHGVCLWLKMREKDIKGAKEAVELLKTSKKDNPFVGLPPYMDESTLFWSAVNGQDDIENYNQKYRGGKKNDSELNSWFNTTNDNDGSGRGGGGRGGGRGGRAGRGGGMGSGGERT